MSESSIIDNGGLTQREEDEIHMLLGPQKGGRPPKMHGAMLRVKDRQVVSNLYAAYLNLKQKLIENDHKYQDTIDAFEVIMNWLKKSTDIELPTAVAVAIYVLGLRQQLDFRVIRRIFDAWKNLSKHSKNEISKVLDNVIRAVINQDSTTTNYAWRIYRAIAELKKQAQHSDNTDEAVISSMIDDIIQAIEYESSMQSSEDSKRESNRPANSADQDNLTFRVDVDVNPYLVRI